MNSGKEQDKKKIRTVDYNLKDVFAYYKGIVKTAVNYATFSKVIKSFNKHFVNELYDGAYLTLPHKLGDIFIIKYKPVYKFSESNELNNHGQVGMIDYKATKELWVAHPELAHKQRVFYSNEHSDGFKFKIKWLPGKVRNKAVYTFIPAKSLKRNLAKYIRNNPNKDYHGN